MKIYSLQTVGENPRTLDLPLMTLSDAEKARDVLASAGKPVRVVNSKGE